MHNMSGTPCLGMGCMRSLGMGLGMGCMRSLCAAVMGIVQGHRIVALRWPLLPYELLTLRP